MTTAADVMAEAARAWPAAKAAWSSWLQLGAPVHDPHLPSVAAIHLGTRRVALQAETLAEAGLLHAVEGLLAHEVGHHVAFPGTLAVQARMRVIERALVPLPGCSVLNLFTDLLINERLGDRYRDAFADAYRALITPGAVLRDPVLGLVMATYEELWGLEVGALLGGDLDAFEAAHPHHRPHATVIAAALPRLGPNVYTQLLFFLSMVRPYVPRPAPDEAPDEAAPACLPASPSSEDWAEALQPNAREREAVDRAVREGWLRPEERDRLADLGARVAGLPGVAAGEADGVPEVMAAWYRREAERWLLAPPPARVWGEPLVPTVLEPWEAGAPLSAVDWGASVREGGLAWARARPLVRVREPEEEGLEVPAWLPRLEVYLDVSGSMPDPRRGYNPMTLAAMVLVLGALRSGGAARLALYSTDVVTSWAWARSERQLAGFLMHYLGGGTRFPFELLRRSVATAGAEPPCRVVISDMDFDANVAQLPLGRPVLAEAARASRPLVLVLAHPDPEAVAGYRALGAHVVEVSHLAAFPEVAVSLARALFDGGADGLA